jgi:HEPN domain-containing protein
MSKNIDPFEETKTIIKQAFPGDKTIAHVDEIMEFIRARRITWNADEASRKLSIAFLDEADRDLKSCRALYSKKIYSHAVYHLQQAVEKAMKGYCLGLGILSIQEIRSHDTPYLLLKGLFEKTGMKTLLESLGEDAKDRLGKAWEAIEKPEKRLEIARMPFEQIINSLNDIDDYELKSQQIGVLLNELAANVKDRLGPLPLEITTISVMANLYILGSVSFPHEEFTRYPDRQMTPTEYVPKLGIVKAISKMIDYLAPAVKDLRYTLRNM